MLHSRRVPLFYGQTGSWTGDIQLWDVYENSKYGSFGENHMTFSEPTIHLTEEVIVCEVLDKKCKTVQEFNSLVQPYMNN